MNMNGDDLLSEVRKCLLKFGVNKKSLRGDGLVKRVAKQIKVHEFDLKPVFKYLRDNNEIDCVDWKNGFPLSSVKLNITNEVPYSEIRWVASMQAAGINVKDQSLLVTLHKKLEVLEDGDQRLVAKGLLSIRKDLALLEGQSRYIVSAKYLLGSSKFLDSLPSSDLKDFGIDLNKFKPAPSYIITAGPKHPDAVLLIENPQSMEELIKCNIANSVAIVATFGYGLSMVGDEYGRQLADIIENPSRVIHSLVRSGSPPSLAELLTMNHIYFWGDLDLEGLRIFSRLKTSLPNLELSGLYKPMIELLLQSLESSHPYNALTGKQGQRLWSSNHLVINNLIKACTLRGIDQEVLTSSQLKPLMSLTSCSLQEIEVTEKINKIEHAKGK